VGLGDRGRHRPAELSGGEQQRVAVPRALVTEPAVVWADEPTGNLDSATASAVLELFHEVNGNGQTMVVVTHDADIGATADRVLEVHDGIVVNGGSVDSSARSDSFRLRSSEHHTVEAFR
jgi:putative ABC transport system ATP-binding protein